MARSLTKNIVSEVASREDIDPAEVDFVLQDHVDVDAIERLVGNESESWVLTFELLDYTVTLRGTGEINVEEKTI